MPRNVKVTPLSRAVGRQEAAEMLGCSVRVIDDMLRDGRLRRVLIGQKYKITLASIDELLSQTA